MPLRLINDLFVNFNIFNKRWSDFRFKTAGFWGFGVSIDLRFKYVFFWNVGIISFSTNIVPIHAPLVDNLFFCAP